VSSKQFSCLASIIEAQICDSQPICDSLLMTRLQILARHLRLFGSVLARIGGVPLHSRSTGLAFLKSFYLAQMVYSIDID
jgi:hypothetical protein